MVPLAPSLLQDNTYKRDEILTMEGMILNRLKFELSVATTRVFLIRASRATRTRTGVG